VVQICAAFSAEVLELVYSIGSYGRPEKLQIGMWVFRVDNDVGRDGLEE
jgi:hypothetical protein